MTFILQDTPRLVSNCISWLSSHEKHWWIKITILGPKLYIPSGDQRWLAGIPPFLTSILGTFHPDLIQFQHCEGRPLCPGHGDISSYILDIISGDYHQNYLFENLKKPPTRYEMCRTNTTTILTEPDWRRVLAAVSNYYYPSKIRFFQVARIHPEIVTYIPSRKCTEQKKNSVFETRLALGAKKTSLRRSLILKWHSRQHHCFMHLRHEMSTCPCRASCWFQILAHPKTNSWRWTTQTSLKHQFNDWTSTN